MQRKSIDSKKWNNIRLLNSARPAPGPLVVKPDNSRFLIIDRKKDGSKVFIGGSSRNIKAGEDCTKELVSRPILVLACFRAVAGAFASIAETGTTFVAHGA